MHTNQDIRFDLAHARQRELIAAGERGRQGRRFLEADADGGWNVDAGRARPSRRPRLLRLVLRRARPSLAREQGHC